MTQELLIGAHTSAAGGAYKALLEGKQIGATTIQLFTANQRRWANTPLPPEAVALWQETIAQTNITSVMSHDSYLINLGAPDPEILQKSRQAFAEEIQRCIQLNLTFLNFHPGAALTDNRQHCLDRICESIFMVEDLVGKSSLRLLFESTAGQGSVIGARFEELAYLIQKTAPRVRVGVCIDTCHAFAAGYDLRTAEACDAMLKEFDRIVGLKHLFAFHLNDSLKGLGSRVDRHRPLGEGLIGLECFKFLMTDPRTRSIPKYLETPDGPPLWTKEIAMLREMAGEK
ncbi:MAG: deoxyribonuclease IV [Parachlamydiaceae bacterium]|nr:deoxyribonuclease IV [Parachlamydiaceae bacterium]